MDFFKSINKTLLITCASIAVLGLLIAIWPVGILRLICYIVALGLIAVGVLRIMTYTKELKAAEFGKLPNLAIGLSLIVGGIIFAFTCSILDVIMPFVLCMLVWFGALFLCQRAVNGFFTRKADWWVQTILGGVALILAILVSIQLNNNLFFLLLEIDGFSTLKELMTVTGIGSTLWLLGLSMILVSLEVVASYVIPDFMPKKA